MLASMGLLVACGAFSDAAPGLTDQTPDFVTPGALDCVVPILVGGADGRDSLGSGVVVAPDVVLTAAHVLAAAPRDDDWVSLSVDGVPCRARVLASAAPEAPHGDWAVLQLDEPTRAPPARLHQPARAPSWQPSAGMDVLLVGYAIGFFSPAAGGEVTIPIDEPTPCVRATIRAEQRPDCWLAATPPLDLVGMSGGAAMVWNFEEQRAEVIGLVTGFEPWVETVTTTTRRRAQQGAPQTMVREVSTVTYQLRRLPPPIANPGADLR